MKIKVHENYGISERQLNEMACVGVLDDFEIQVWNREGRNIPHVHVYNCERRNKNTKIDVCIQLERAQYFEHGKHTGTLNAEQRKDFDSYMRKPHKNGVFATNYEFAVFLWNNMDDVKKVIPQKDNKGNVIIPDYTEIAPYKK